ncbi:MAG TPA: hypothetical protein VFC41_01340 [Anaerovoracaceae bacterium]|nr:hypothetical protein [Anaerovoracaceae bacterium]
MHIANYEEYFNKKKSFLDSLLKVSEDLLSNSNDYDLFMVVLNNREDLIQEISEFENRFKHDFNDSLTCLQTSELNAIAKLILGLDAQTYECVVKDKNKISALIKTNVKEQKFDKYNSISNIQDGGLLDYKK